ncbi:hypothetical protein [Saccharophagus degradans]|uniref:Coproporphyrinogen III oxidase n=1 Tax=Saccharophagus degradans (strain 2-40 / ATCC 43961 / DSM 17024) TaxID=203122 RepID=Q21NM3_SACD2|nr:hypothetical protein [Saccharophagus degradans]ABD79706.1 coproporphyrinogen III oxidase [Saccharophagus degradans 2-40]
MTGLNHDFLVIDSESFSIDNYEEYKQSDYVEIHDDLLSYFADTLAWLSSYNPCMEEEATGLCWYGPTIIKCESASKLKSILSGWLQILYEAPDIVSLKGSWSWIEGESQDSGSYEKLTFSKNELVVKLKKLISFCELVRSSGGNKCLLHIGI